MVRASRQPPATRTDPVQTVLACDLGGTSFRAALIDAGGVTIAEAARPTGIPVAPDGRSEVDPEIWWQALIACAGDLAEFAPEAFAAVAGIGICGITRSQVCLDASGAPLGPAITFRDSRAAAGLSGLRERLPPDHPETGQVNAAHPVARLAVLPEALRGRLAAVVDPKDDLNRRLTGRVASDPVSLARLAAAARPGPDGRSLLQAIGLSDGIVPDLRDPTAAVGPVLRGLPAPLDRLGGRPVFCLCNDTWAGVLGLGALRPGYAYDLSGTTEVLGLVDDRPLAAPGLMTVDWGVGLHQLGGPSDNGADTLAWLVDLLGQGGGDIGGALDRLLATPRDPRPLLFLPYLQGERVPLWQPQLRGAFLGLDRRHGPADLAWALLEGVAFTNRMVLERAEAAAGRPVVEVRFGGGGAGSRVWAAIKADILGRPVVTAGTREPGLLGAAIAVWTGLGRHASLGAAQAALTGTGLRFDPDPARRTVYEPMFELFRRSVDAVLPVSEALGRLRAPSRESAP
ncbi:carbohydrate kinase [Prosthecomicrobium hirschii]|uniref:Carbohydrate kinase n=1 Tax=Prosthecodimorpha hirschii TaxID=665126 RepID=A0A0P6W0X7_9HYPH|nr:carbohydrate kinase [Prosthecomicrobium hirschii]